jgi:hypothetical protein
MKKYTIDRFEGNYAVCEDEKKVIIKIPKYKLPLECKEGDVLIQDEDGMYHIDKGITAANDTRVRGKIGRLFE